MHNNYCGIIFYFHVSVKIGGNWNNCCNICFYCRLFGVQLQDLIYILVPPVSKPQGISSLFFFHEGGAVTNYTQTVTNKINKFTWTFQKDNKHFAQKSRKVRIGVPDRAFYNGKCACAASAIF